MNNNEKNEKKSFYLITIDFLQGFYLYIMIFGHGVLWWDRPLGLAFDSSNNWIVHIGIAVGLLVFPVFLFLYGLNTMHSFLKSSSVANRPKVRSRVIRKSLFFAFFGFLAQFLMGLITGDLFYYLFSWELFHMFAFTSLYILLMVELTWLLCDRTKIGKVLDYRKTFIALFITSLIVVFVLFLIFHDYSHVRVEFHANLELISILSFAILDTGQCSIIPWLSFGLAGALFASFLDLPQIDNRDFSRRALSVVLGSIPLLILGILLLSIERYEQPAVEYRATTSFVFIAIGAICISTVLLLRILDFDSRESPRRINRIIYPFVIVSNITFTVFFTHNLFFGLNPSIIPTETLFYIFTVLYWLFFVLIAHIWKKWNFRYSLEWFLITFQRLQFRKNKS